MTARDLLEAGDLTAASGIRDIPGIGRVLGGRMEALHILTVGDFVQYFNHMSATGIRERLSRIVQNARPNQCVAVGGRGGPAATQFLADNNQDDLRYVRYQIREVNYVAFNNLRGILAFARLANNRNDFGPRAVDIPSLPAEHAPRTTAACFCSCIPRRRICEDRFGTSCRWDPDEAACVPRDDTDHGFEPAGQFKGQNLTEGFAAPTRGQYAGNWKQPDALYPLLPMPAPYGRRGGGGRRGRGAGLAAAPARGRGRARAAPRRRRVEEDEEENGEDEGEEEKAPGRRARAAPRRGRRNEEEKGEDEGAEDEGAEDDEEEEKEPVSARLRPRAY